METLINRARFTVLLGKNGSGKSTWLRKLNASTTFATKYVSPERGGILKYDPGVETNISNDENWMKQDRNKNRTESFRQQSAAQFRMLEILILREIEQDNAKRQDITYSFNNTLDKINALLPAIQLLRSDRGFKIFSKDGLPINEEQISSGEAELIALSIEVLVFSRESKQNKLLILDEPDVHLHPDLQHKFVEFIEKIAIEFNFKIALATHSTAIIGAFSKDVDLQIVPITTKEQSTFNHFKFDPICNEILPVFGSHPLSSQFNKSPVLLVEGDDDKRVIDQIVRSSRGRYNFSPCVVGTVDEMKKWENWLNDFLPAIYDSPAAYSLRDLDDSPQAQIENLGCVIRTRLNCYAMENLLLTEECLALARYSTQEFKFLIDDWVTTRPEHQASSGLRALSDNFNVRRTIKVKDIRNVIVALLGIQKPWEIAVGQLILSNLESQNRNDHSVTTYLGKSVLKNLFGKTGT